jgi:actin-like ATPase involved in cell morphogenesis
MTVVELKHQIVNRIKETTNPGILEEVYRLLAIESDTIFVLSEEQLKSIEEAKNQIKQGLFKTNEQTDKEIDEWLNQ